MTSNRRTSGKSSVEAVAIRYRLRHSPHSAFAATRPGSMQKVLESTPAAEQPVTRPKPGLALMIAVAALAAAASLTVSSSGAAGIGVQGGGIAPARVGAPHDLFDNHESGDGVALKSGLTYRASLFPLAINVRPMDKLWEGDQYLRTSGLHEGTPRKGARFAFVDLLHKYAHNAGGKVSNWGRGTITFEAGFAPTGSVQTTMNRLRGRLEDFQTVSAVKPIRIAGYSGLSYDGRLKDGTQSYHRFVPFSSSDGSQQTTDSIKIEANSGKGQAFRIIVLNVRGTTIAIYVRSETAPPDKFPVFLGFANRLLSTMTFPR